MRNTIVILLTILFASTAAINAGGNPRRNSTPVNDVSKPYTANEWIISPDEESIGDEDAGQAIECDIKGVISCYDNDYLRVDILLNNSISFEWKTLYAIKLEYDNMSEYYTYYTETKKMVYEKEENGEITKTTVLSMDDSKDVAGVSDSGEDLNSDVYFIINKEAHIGGEKGNRYFLTCKFFSGYLTTSDELHIADETKFIELEFEY
ncbi:MAG: hypothetical protein V1720_20580 [bacterium]